MNYEKVEERKQANLLLHHKKIKHLGINLSKVLKVFMENL